MGLSDWADKKVATLSKGMAQKVQLALTEGNLLRGKEVFLQRCVGCHGIAGDGKGPGASFMSPAPADFTSADDACCGGDTGPGDFYYRILRGWPGTAMENFGERLSVDDIWRVVI